MVKSPAWAKWLPPSAKKAHPRDKRHRHSLFGVIGGFVEIAAGQGVGERNQNNADGERAMRSSSPYFVENILRVGELPGWD